MLLEALLPVPGSHEKYSQEEDYTPQTDPPAPTSWYWALLQNVHRSAYQLLLPLCILPHYVLHPRRQIPHWKSLSGALVTAFSDICGKLLHEVLSDSQSQQKNLHKYNPHPGSTLLPHQHSLSHTFYLSSPIVLHKYSDQHFNKYRIPVPKHKCNIFLWDQFHDARVKRSKPTWACS